MLNRADPHWTLDFAAVWQKKHHTDPTGPQQHTLSVLEMNLFMTLELLASPGLFIQQIHVAGQILICLLKDQRWQRGSLAERHLTTDWSGALTAPCVAPLSTLPGTLRHLGSTRSQKQLSDLQRNVSDSIYNIQNMCYDTNMKPSENNVHKLLFCTWNITTRSHQLVAPPPPQRGVIMRATRSGRSSLTSSGSRVSDGPLDSTRIRWRSS